MEQLNYQQKISILRILLDIINADGVIDARELYYFNKVKEELELEEEDLNEVRVTNSLLALAQIREFDEEQKKAFAALMSRMVIIDEDINVNEMAIYEIVCEFCKIPFRFQDLLTPEEIANCSQSK